MENKNSLKLNREIDVRTFIYLYVSVCYVKEQRIINKLELEKYITLNYSPEYLENIHMLDVYHEIDEIFEDMIEKGILVSEIHNNGLKDDGKNQLYRVTNMIDFKNIILENQEDYAYVLNFFYSVQDKGFSNIIVTPNKERQKK